LILARIVQAVGAAGTMANNQGIITETFPQNERGKALGFLGTSVALRSLVGLSLGGLIVGAASWEFIFLINVPIGMGLFQSPNNSLIMSTVPKDKLGIAGSVNALVRNLGMVCGIALATTLLYSMMSSKIGYRVTNYVAGRNDAFIYGMKAVYIAAAIIGLVGALLTFLRLKRKKALLQNEIELIKNS
jgi:MFS family permease